MGLESLSQVELIQVTFSLIFVVISLIVGLKILLKYFKLKNKVLITVGLTWIFLSSPWWGNAISFFIYMFIEQEIDLFWDLFLGNIFIPVAVVLWVYSFSELVYPQLKRKLLTIYLIISIPYEILLIMFFFIDIEIIGSKTARFNTEHNLYPFSYQILAILTALITGILLARESLRSEDKRIQLKGKFLLLGFTSFTVAAIFDAAIPMDPILLAIIRTVLIMSAFEYYLGFLLPDWIADRLIKS
ncbi:MAG: hypothetical protein ACFFHV_11690 [Promethearchaeota archaeon]